MFIFWIYTFMDVPVCDVLKRMFVCDGSVIEFSHDASQLPVDVCLD